MTVVLSDQDRAFQARLHAALSDDPRPQQLENLAAELIGQLLGVEVAVAQSGSQHGGDAGPAGRQGRRFRIECKKYRETTALSHRELLGELDQAVGRDEAIEAWVLVATRTVPEQLRQELEQHGDRLGVPVLIFSWAADSLSTLAALCASGPQVVGRLISADAGVLARKLAAIAGDAIDEIRSELASWTLGFEILRRKSHEKIREIWHSSKVSNAELGQDAAGGSHAKRIKRQTVSRALDVWWAGQAQTDAPLVVLGAEGVGKTWATLDWLADHIVEQPILFVVPSSAVASLQTASQATVKRFFAERCYELTGQRSVDHWLRRLDRLTQRPTDEGPAITIVFDGINQEPSVSWLQILKILQAPPFAGRVRSIVSTRPHFFTDRLSELKGLIASAVKTTVEVYSVEPGGEFDQMLALEGLTRTSLHPDLVDLARTPRLFKLVVRLRNRLADAHQITVHRLLWEYGRDSFGERAGRSFSEAQWRQYLQDIAAAIRQGATAFNERTLGEAATRPDLSTGDVYARLSDIIDGRFTRAAPSGAIEFTPTVVAHSLAGALLAALAPLTTATHDVVDAALTKWLDPIAGLDQSPEILRAAVAILIERGDKTDTPIAGALVAAWLQSQNLPENHRRELEALAANLVSPLLDSIERSTSHTQLSARLSAVNALRAIPRTDSVASTTIVDRATSWLRPISRDVRASGFGSTNDFEKQRAKRLIDCVGVDRSGPMTILGHAMTFVDYGDGVLGALVPSILEGFPLAPAASVIEMATINEMVGRGNAGLDGLQWLLILNEIDAEATAEALRAHARSVQQRLPETGISTRLSVRVARRLLSLTGYESDEIAALAIGPADQERSYENAYLASPATSFFKLERRHVDAVLGDATRPIYARLQRTKSFWSSPTFSPTPSVVDEIRRAASTIDPAKLDSAGSITIDDHAFGELEPVLARCAPDLLADIGRRKLLMLQDASREQRYWRAIAAPHQLMIANAESRKAARALRTRFTENEAGNELYASTQLLIVELHGEQGSTQASRIIEAGLEVFLNALGDIIAEPSSEQVDAVFTRFEQGTLNQQQTLLSLLLIYRAPLSEKIWTWLEAKACGHDPTTRGIAFRILERANADRFGRRLIEWDWTWSSADHYWCNHYGSGAIISGASSVPFDQIVPRLAPWRVLEAARLRGNDPADVRLAADIFGSVLVARTVPEVDPGSELAIDVGEPTAFPGSYVLRPRENEDTTNDPFAAITGAQEAQVQPDAWRRAVDTAYQRISQAQAAGANLYLSHISAQDLDPVWTYARPTFDTWTEGLDHLTSDFRRRVRLAELAFLAICETLLNNDPIRGVKLWRSLRQVTSMHHVGRGRVEDLIHIVFRVKDSPEVDLLRASLVDLRHCSSDECLAEIALAADLNGRRDWIESQIKSDHASPYVWRQRRAVVLSGFVSDNSVEDTADWPTGALKSSFDSLKVRAIGCRRCEAEAHHWWRAFLAAPTVEAAYAAWVLFLQTCDRRGWVWLHRDISAATTSGGSFDTKIAHAKVNQPLIDKQLESHDTDLARTYLGLNIVAGVGPWRTNTARPE
jgi:hypothetical protein